jgi:phosphoribosylformylglycinamidine synthase
VFPVPEGLIRLYRTPALSTYRNAVLLSAVHERISRSVRDIETEHCFYVEASGPLSEAELTTLRWLLTETFEPEKCSSSSFLASDKSSHTGGEGEGRLLIEVGPRMNFTTAWSTNAVSVCHACGLTMIRRIERSRRYSVLFGSSSMPSGVSSFHEQFLGLVHDRMTECHYPQPLSTFEMGITPEPVVLVPLIEEGRPALVEVNQRMGLGLDDWDIDYYFSLFAHGLKRNPTNVECFDLSQSNSEHSRHWFFKGRLVVDGRDVQESLMEVVKEPYLRNPRNSVIAFSDNSSAIQGSPIVALTPGRPGHPSPFREQTVTYHLLFTAETHNFPSGVAPFPGAETGTGGRIRDVHATGTGSLVVAGTAAYCVGNLCIPGYRLPWEDASLVYPGNLASPLRIEIEASNGASDYGNKFGEPLIQGFTRSFGLVLPSGERREWLKPIMFTGGVGQIDGRHTEKGAPEKGMLVVKVGGPAYRIGIGGGSASSMIHGENVEELDFNAVQRGDAEMEQKLNRVIRACVELGENNPIVSIHDQGAGGNCNVVKEIIYPAGGKIEVRKIPIGDQTLSVLEIWGAEYQEQDAFLIPAERIDDFMALCAREKVPGAAIGRITGDGSIVLYDERGIAPHEITPVDLDLQKILGDMPRKSFRLDRVAPNTKPLELPRGLTVRDALDRVLRLVSVGSKRFLTNKVDRSVTGLIVRQQCCGPLQLTVSDVAVVAQSHFGLTGAAISIGEQPIKGLIDPAAMARMSVAEALTNIVWAKITSLEDIRCSANWMWAPKLPGEGAALYDAAVAMRDLMRALGIAVDGGKDSLSMAARVRLPSGENELVKSPGTLVISAYAACPDITKVITPDIKAPGESVLLFIDLAEGNYRLGGSALAHCYEQIGDQSPDVSNAPLLREAFSAVQDLIDEGLVLAGHDRSDGGLITTLLEMAFAGNCGFDVDLSALPEGASDPFSLLFSEELGMVIECRSGDDLETETLLSRRGVPWAHLGKTTAAQRTIVRLNGAVTLDEDMKVLRSLWEETSFQLDALQANPQDVSQERESTFDRPGPALRVSFEPIPTPHILVRRDAKPAVAIVREEGSNGDREMTSAFHHAGLEPWDVTMTDLLKGAVSLARFKGIAFVGGFSYADVLDSAKGWAGTIRFNAGLYADFQRFYARKDTFSLGVCNGCQLMALLGWVPWQGIPDVSQPRFIHNHSGRFESRFSTVKILESPSLMLRRMEGSVLGVWVAHGEGRVHFPDDKILNDVLARSLAPIRYVDDAGAVTETYPFNPNGSPAGITALCSSDGRHLALMPHPERTFLTWQWGWMPEDMKRSLNASPWLRMFQNARQWCDTT